MRYSRLLIVSIFCAASAALASDDGVFVNPHVLERAGVPQTVVWNARGSQANIVGTTGGLVSGAAACRLNVSLYDTSELLDLFVAASHGQRKAAKYDIAYIGKPSEQSSLYSITLEPMVLNLPACDADSKEPRCAEASFRHRELPVKAGISGTTSRARIEAKKQKQWLPANFRLRCGDINTTRVQTVESVELHLKEVTDTDVVIEEPTFAFTLPMSDAGPFRKLLEEAMAGKQTAIPLRLEYLDENGVPLFTIDTEVFVMSVGPKDMFAPPSPDALARVEAKSKWYPIVVRPSL
ncbi:MAG: hypothetical protein QOJ65_1393 [Fimbriimonadaceae bacterium]|jgi:hypothetical protein|nr:hypothetical protein [Fimbriimonadaceae bacterium]